VSQYQPGAPPHDDANTIGAAITDISERASVLVREEIELAKAEINEKAGKIIRGAIVGVVAGIFFATALLFVLVGCAWLLYYYLPIGGAFTYFYGFFATAVILIVLGALAAWVAARAVKRGAPPVPNMAIEEARKIRETVGGDGVPPASPQVPPAATAGRPGSEG
jgi:uncharacterized membrane protein YqjE